MDLRTAIRAAFLVLAAGLLTSAGCDEGDVGSGDELGQVTVRGSVLLDGTEPREACSGPSISSDGRYLVFASKSNNLTANDSNGLSDVFLKDRLTGEIENLTHYVVPPAYALYNPSDCTGPVISGDARYVLFSTLGNYDPPPSLGGLPPLNPHPVVYRYDRVLKQFKAVYGNPAAFVLDDDMMEPTISHDGRYVAFLSAATNFPGFSSGGHVQVWVSDMTTRNVLLVSRGDTSTTPCGHDCQRAQISGNGQFVVFESQTDTLVSGVPATFTQVYLGTASGDPVEAVGRNSGGQLTDMDSTCPAISHDGRYVAFTTSGTNMIPGVTLTCIVRRDRTSGAVELVTDKPGTVYATAAKYPPDCLPNAISPDGRFVGFLSSNGSLYPARPISFHQVFVKDMLGGISMASRHQDGTPCNLDCERVVFSGDGAWVAWQTLGATLADDDRNGATDVYLRGPLR
jgi:Tol biopolymer transport system component